MGPRAVQRVLIAGLVATALSAVGGCRVIDAEGFPCSTTGACPPGYSCDGKKVCRAHLDAGGTGGAHAGGDAHVDGSQVTDGGHPKDGSLRPDGGSSNCTAGKTCAVANPCHVGRIACGDAGPICQDTQGTQPNGTSCGGGDAGSGGPDGGTGMVCSAGACVACSEGSACTLSDQPCELGQTSCGTGSPVCKQAGNVKDGIGCGSGMVCASGACKACTDGASCVPTNACNQGKLSCSGTVTCVDQQVPITDGSSCGTDQVCSAGTCISCKVGQSCTLPASEPCRTGATTCNTGQPVCVESGNVTNGNSCGSGMVCSDGACTACATGNACVPTNPCHTGTLDCGQGTPSCVDTTMAAKDGTICGTNEVCSTGLCVNCVAAQSCTPSGTTCKVGTTSCSTGASVCTMTGNAQDGSTCGNNQVCSGGSCATCVANMPCTPSTAPCHVGALSCANGTPTCVDQLTILQNGTVCGTNLVCSGGSCVNCVAQNPCTPNGNSCQTGTTVCSSGSSVCMLTGNVSPGTTCGSGGNMVCNGGSCVTCAASMACTPPNAPCHVGSQSCASGAPVCVDQNIPATNGTTCGTNLGCASGSCSCTQGTTCTPSGMPCKTGTTSCTTGASVCTAAGNVTDGTTCAAGMTCMSGSCQPMAGCTSSTPTLGCPCTTSGVTACNGAHQKLQLICTTVAGESGLAWQTLSTCSSAQNCDQTVGACAPIIAGCTGQSPGYSFCASGAIDVSDTCGQDLVSVTTQTCPGICSGGVCQTPKCGDGKVEAGEQCDDGNNTPIDGCEPASAPLGAACQTSHVQSLALGAGHTCALFLGGYVRCWGDNALGQLGLGHAQFEGNNKPYQLTVFDANNNPQPAGPINLGGAATAISAGEDLTCALLSDQSVRCWGANDQGQLGLGNTAMELTATPGSLGPVSIGGSATAITVGNDSVCVLLTTGNVRCWGSNGIGILGQGNTTALSATMVPSQIPTVSLGATVTAVSAGSSDVCALLSTGQVRCWGDNLEGELGLGDKVQRSPTMVPTAYGAVLLASGKTATSISMGGDTACVRFSDGTAECWGDNSFGEIGVGNTQFAIGDNESPATAGLVMVPASGVSSIYASGLGASTCSLFPNGGGVHCWGDNSEAELGYPDLNNRGSAAATIPSNAAGVPAINFGAGNTVSSHYLGALYACALLTTNELRCWGQNDKGQLGLGYTSGSPTDYVGGSTTTTPNNAITSVQLYP
jgi:alpha-tubulin suppressor-like RCC1 family protein